MYLEVNGKYIEEPIINILYQLKKECHWQVFDKIEDKGEYIRCTCPYHADGHEKHPSFSVYADYSGDIIPGTYHCFTCNAKGQLYNLVAKCLNLNEEQAKEWLVERYGFIGIDNYLHLEDIELNKKEENFLDESILDKYSYFHPYMFQRKLKENVIRKFRIGYDKDTDSITFPIWNENNKLVGITKRNISTKRFDIPSQIKKPIYLLNAIKNQNFPYVIVCEAQIDALTSWGYGVPAIAMLGVGSKEQYDILNKTCVNWVTMFDNDEAGIRATERFNKLIRKDCLVTNITIPNGKKDINDLNEDEFNTLLNSYNLTWRLVDF